MVTLFADVAYRPNREQDSARCEIQSEPPQETLAGDPASKHHRPGYRWMDEESLWFASEPVAFSLKFRTKRSEEHVYGIKLRRAQQGLEANCPSRMASPSTC